MNSATTGAITFDKHARYTFCMGEAKTVLAERLNPSISIQSHAPEARNSRVYGALTKLLEVIFLNVSQEYLEFVFKTAKKTVFGLMLVSNLTIWKKIFAATVKSKLYNILCTRRRGGNMYTRIFFITRFEATYFFVTVWPYRYNRCICANWDSGYRKHIIHL